MQRGGEEAGAVAEPDSVSSLPETPMKAMLAEACDAASPAVVALGHAVRYSGAGTKRVAAPGAADAAVPAAGSDDADDDSDDAHAGEGTGEPTAKRVRRADPALGREHVRLDAVATEHPALAASEHEHEADVGPGVGSDDEDSDQNDEDESDGESSSGDDQDEEPELDARGRPRRKASKRAAQRWRGERRSVADSVYDMTAASAELKAQAKRQRRAASKRQSKSAIMQKVAKLMAQLGDNVPAKLTGKRKRSDGDTEAGAGSAKRSKTQDDVFGDASVIAWSQPKVRAWCKRQADPEAYLMMLVLPHMNMHTGKWTAEEREAFLQHVERFRSNGWPANWALFSLDISHRNGKQCNAMYSSLLKDGTLPSNVLAEAVAALPTDQAVAKAGEMKRQLLDQYQSVWQREDVRAIEQRVEALVDKHHADVVAAKVSAELVDLIRSKGAAAAGLTEQAAADVLSKHAQQEAARAAAKARRDAEREQREQQRLAQRTAAQIERDAARAKAAAEKEAARAAAKAAKEAEAAARQAEKEKERAARQAEKEKERAARQAEKEKERADRQAEKEKERAARQAEKERAEAAAREEKEKELKKNLAFWSKFVSKAPKPAAPAAPAVLDPAAGSAGVTATSACAGASASASTNEADHDAEPALFQMQMPVQPHVLPVLCARPEVPPSIPAIDRALEMCSSNAGGPSTASLCVKLGAFALAGRARRRARQAAMKKAPAPWRVKACAVLGHVVPLRMQLLQFHTSERPAYYGTNKRRSQRITGRRPFARDTGILDYDVESEDEWEEEEEGESVSDNEDDDAGDGDDYLLDDWCVGDADADADDGDDAVPTGAPGIVDLTATSDAVASAAAAAAVSASADSGTKQQRLLAAPVIVGPVWADQQVPEAVQAYAAVVLATAPIAFDRSKPAGAAQRDPAAAEMQAGPALAQLEPQHQVDLMRHVHGASGSKARLVDAFVVDHPSVTKAAAERAMAEIVVREKRGATKPRIWVRDQAMAAMAARAMDHVAQDGVAGLPHLLADEVLRLCNAYEQPENLVPVVQRGMLSAVVCEQADPGFRASMADLLTRVVRPRASLTELQFILGKGRGRSLISCILSVGSAEPALAGEIARLAFSMMHVMKGFDPQNDVLREMYAVACKHACDLARTALASVNVKQCAFTIILLADAVGAAPSGTRLHLTGLDVLLPALAKFACQGNSTKHAAALRLAAAMTRVATSLCVQDLQAALPVAAKAARQQSAEKQTWANSIRARLPDIRNGEAELRAGLALLEAV